MLSIRPRTIYSKGLLLIAVPLLVEVVFGITMFSLQRYYEAKLNKERAAVEIIFHTNDMWVECSEILFLNGYFSVFGGPSPNLEERMARMMSAYRRAKELVADDPGQSENLEKIWSNTTQSLEVSKQLRPLTAINQSGSRKMSILASNLETIERADHFISGMGKPMRNFRQPEFLHSPAAIPEVERSTALVDRLVLGSLAASTLLAVMLFGHFSRSINRGVNVVLENTDRFKKGEELKPAVTGGDELAQVNVAFHEMADEIKEAQRTKQAIVSMISHDLRSPLSSVHGSLLNLVDGIFGDVSLETTADAEKCQREVENLIRLINDLLDLDKIEAGRFELRPQALLVEDAIKQAITAVSPIAEERRVTVEGCESSAEVYADPDRIVQALTNVLSLMVGVSSAGSRVETRTGQVNGEAEIRMTSASASIPEDRLNSLFDRYRQSEGGLRLELPISKAIIQLHGGTIGTRVDQPEGLTFWLRLPLAKAEPSGVSLAGEPV